MTAYIISEPETEQSPSGDKEENPSGDKEENPSGEENKDQENNNSKKDSGSSGDDSTSGSGRIMGFSGYKWTIFVTMYVGYFLYILCRKSFSFAMPTIMTQERLAKDDLGQWISSSGCAVKTGDRMELCTRASPSSLALSLSLWKTPPPDPDPGPPSLAPHVTHVSTHEVIGSCSVNLLDRAGKAALLSHAPSQSSLSSSWMGPLRP